MNWKKITVVFTIATIGAIAGYDVIAIMNGGTEASISHTLIEWSYKYPVFTFAMGFTMGHLFWRVRQTQSLNELETTTKGEQ